MGLFIRLIGGLGGWALGEFADAAEWLRRPGSKLRAACGVLAFCFVLASLSAYKEEERIRELTVQVEKVHAQWKADLIRLQADVDDRDARLTQVAAALRGEAEKLVKLKAESALALNRLASKIEAAEKDASSWRDRYQQRPDNCKAAVELLDTACPGVKGY